MSIEIRIRQAQSEVARDLEMIHRLVEEVNRLEHYSSRTSLQSWCDDMGRRAPRYVFWVDGICDSQTYRSYHMVRFRRKTAEELIPLLKFMLLNYHPDSDYSLRELTSLKVVFQVRYPEFVWSLEPTADVGRNAPKRYSLYYKIR